MSPPTLRALVTAALAFAAAGASASDCTATYMKVTDPSPYDAMAHKALDAQYKITEIDPKQRAWQSPKGKAGALPNAPLDTATGQEIHGKVLMAYVVTADGRVEAPTIVESTHDALTKIALIAAEAWRFQPATLDGKPVCVVAMQEFKF